MQNCQLILKQGNKRILLCTEDDLKLTTYSTNDILPSTTSNIPVTSVEPTTVAPKLRSTTETTITRAYTPHLSPSPANHKNSLNSSYTLMRDVSISENITNLSTFNKTTPGYIYFTNNTTTSNYIYFSNSTTAFMQNTQVLDRSSEPIDHFEIILYILIGVFAICVLVSIYIRKNKDKEIKRRRSVSPEEVAIEIKPPALKVQEPPAPTLKPPRPLRPPPPPEVAKKQADAVLNRGMKISELTQPGGMDKLKAIRNTKGEGRLNRQVKTYSHLRQLQKSINAKKKLNKK